MTEDTTRLGVSTEPDPFNDPDFYLFKQEDMERFDALPMGQPVVFSLNKEHLLHLLFGMSAVRNATFQALLALGSHTQGKFEEAQKHYAESGRQSAVGDNNFRRFFEAILKSTQVVDG